MLSASISATLASPTAHASACSRMHAASASRRAGDSDLRIGEPVDRTTRIEQDARSHHRPGQRTAPRLVDAGDQGHPPHVREPSGICSGARAGALPARLQQRQDGLRGLVRRALAQHAIDLVELLFLPRAHDLVAQLVQQRLGEIRRRGIVLQDLRHREASRQHVRQADVRQQAPRPHQMPGELRHAIGDDHGPLAAGPLRAWPCRRPPGPRRRRSSPSARGRTGW